jgi:hypothetical protein
MASAMNVTSVLNTLSSTIPARKNRLFRALQWRNERKAALLVKVWKTRCEDRRQAALQKLELSYAKRVARVLLMIAKAIKRNEIREQKRAAKAQAKADAKEAKRLAKEEAKRVAKETKKAAEPKPRKPRTKKTAVPAPVTEQVAEVSITLQESVFDVSHEEVYTLETPAVVAEPVQETLD